MTSKRAKYLMLSGLNQQGSVAGAVTELVALNNADVVALRYNGIVVEYEIKVSRSDLRNELVGARCAWGVDDVERYRPTSANDFRWPKVLDKYNKHIGYKGLRKRGYGFRPNLFYFAVPDHLVDYAKDMVRGTSYGVYSIAPFECVKRAKSLHSESCSSELARYLFARAILEYGGNSGVFKVDEV